MRLPRVRLTVRSLMAAVAIVAVLTIPVPWFRILNGGTFPSLTGLRIGMTRTEVESRVGSPTSTGVRPDGTSWMSISRPGSLDWTEMEEMKQPASGQGTSRPGSKKDKSPGL
jgi:hypothetical protein